MELNLQLGTSNVVLREREGELTQAWQAACAITLSDRTGSALAWHTQGRVLGPRLLQQVLRFVSRTYTVQYVELKGYYPV